MTYCRRCLIPDTKPNAVFDADGVCSACRAAAAKDDALAGVDWDERRRAFDAIVEAARERRAPFYDVLVPVSGGKDSITQVARLLGRGLRILAVNVDHAIKTDIGRWNLGRVAAMGATLVTFRPQEPLHTRLIRLGLEDYGDPDLMSHCLLHACPLHVALRFQVPLVVLGENSAAEYGGAAEVAAETQMTRAWFESFAAHSGATPRTIAERYAIPYEELVLYDFPDELPASDTTATFMSHYYRWDSEHHREIAREHGFRELDHPGEGTYRTYVGLDERMNRVHQYLKLLKFGYGRATDHACEDIRAGRLTREEAKALVREHERQPLSDDAVAELLPWLGYTRAEFDAILERYRNRDIWTRDGDGEWIVPGFLEDHIPTPTKGAA